MNCDCFTFDNNSFLASICFFFASEKHGVTMGKALSRNGKC